MFKPTPLKDKYGKTVYIGSVVRVHLVLADEDIVGIVDENPDGFLVVRYLDREYPLLDMSTRGEVFRA